MPLLHLETTADLPENADIPDILEALCDDLIANSGVPSTAVRACHTLRSVWHVGQGRPPAFVHLTASVLAGRDAAWKKSAGESLMQVLRHWFHSSLEAEETSITIEIRDMDKESYFKFP